jgi:hypothetical protein
MTDLMQLLYQYTLETGFTCRLNTREYRDLGGLIDRLAAQLQQKLDSDTWDTLGKYQDALAEQRDAELEALFLAALDTAKALR